MFEGRSRLTLLGIGSGLLADLQSWLTPHGWDCVETPSLQAPADLFVIDSAQATSVRDALVRQIRSFDGPDAGAPILLAAAGEAALPLGITAILPLPLHADTTLAVIENWCGPIDDHAFRDFGNPIFRLIRIAGTRAALDMLRRFAGQLEDGLRYLDQPDRASPVPHQIAGAAGIFGFAELSAVWRAIDMGDSFDPDEARARTSAAIDEIGRRSG